MPFPSPDAPTAPQCAQAYFMGGQHRRCLGLLRGGAPPLTDADVRFRYLAARCLAALGDWEEVLALLSSPGGGPDFEDLAPAVRDMSSRAAGMPPFRRHCG